MYLQENEQHSFDSDSQESFPNKAGSSKHLNSDSDNDNESIGESDAKSNDDMDQANFVKRSANIFVPGKKSNLV